MSVLNRFRLDGRTAMITGSSRGLGFSIARALAEAGADLILVGRDRGELERSLALLTSLGRSVWIIPGDVSHLEGVSTVCNQALQLGHSIDILINNVGGRRLDVPIEDMPMDAWQQMIDLNLNSALVCCQRIGRPMLDRGRGSIVNITSIAGPITIKGIHGRHYETAKAALSGLTRSLAADWAGRGVRVNAIAPGVFATAPNVKWFHEKPDFQNLFLSHIPMNRLGNPEEVGPAAVFLASDAASYVTGTTLVIDGGYTCW